MLSSFELLAQEINMRGFSVHIHYKEKIIYFFSKEISGIVCTDDTKMSPYHLAKFASGYKRKMMVIHIIDVVDFDINIVCERLNGLRSFCVSERGFDRKFWSYMKHKFVMKPELVLNGNKYEIKQKGQGRAKRVDSVGFGPDTMLELAGCYFTHTACFHNLLNDMDDCFMGSELKYLYQEFIDKRADYLNFLNILYDQMYKIEKEDKAQRALKLMRQGVQNGNC